MILSLKTPLLQAYGVLPNYFGVDIDYLVGRKND